MRGQTNWNTLQALAEEHGVVWLLAEALAESGAIGSLPETARRQLEWSRQRHERFALALTAEFFRIAEAFRAAGIASLVVKGPALAVQAHGDAASREFLDMDLLVRHTDVPRAVAAMERRGFALRTPLASAAKRAPGQFLFVREETRAIVEIHSERTLRYFVRPIPIEEFLARSAGVAAAGGTIPALSPEDTLIFICVHGSKHFWERLLWIADVAGILARHPALDWDLVSSVARKTQTERMLRLGLWLARNVLGAELPRRPAAELDEDSGAHKLAEEIAAKITAGEPASRMAWGRGLLRMRMCGGAARGAGYLLRLMFSPTEEDWGEARSPGPAWKQAVLRPLRLARKHRVEARGTGMGAD
ncbi:MAG TPA: nucleotidyltransferase family protein [Methylomirabilota bacterium]|nr:nucleotidyltransferase family protein [Methylomirabilota bacterium]